METLISTLRTYSKISHKLGDNEEVSVHGSVLEQKKERLQSMLTAIVQRNTVFVWIIVGMVIVLFTGSIAIAIIYIHNLDTLKVLFGTGGVLTILLGFVQKMQSLWKDKVNSEMLLALISSANDETLNAVITVLLNKL